MIKYGTILFFSILLIGLVVFLGFALGEMGGGSPIPANFAGAPFGLYYVAFPLLACLSRSKKESIRLTVALMQVVQVLGAVYCLLPVSETIHDYQIIIKHHDGLFAIIHISAYLLTQGVLVFGWIKSRKPDADRQA